MTALETHPSRRTRAGRVLRAPAMLSSLTLLLVVFASNAAYLLKIRTNNPLFYHSGLGYPEPGHTNAPYSASHGPHTIDANDGWTAQALGRLAADMWGNGHVPLWNAYEGLGQPLAGEMQSAGLFLPFVLLQSLPNGIFVFHIALELVAGFGTLLFLRRLGLSWVAATTGGCLFAVNGAFSVMTNAPFNPIAFLPVALWGVELVVSALREDRSPRAGMWVAAMAIAMMLFAGFPETAYLEGLVVTAWAVYRFIDLPGRRRRFLGWALTGAVVGVLIAAPILVAFVHMLDFGYIGYHDGESRAWGYDKKNVSSLALQYLAGPMGVNPISGGQAGYLTLPAVFLAFIGFAGKRPRALKVIFGAMIVLLVFNMFGSAIANHVLNLIPGMKSILIYKYAVVIIEFAVIVWAAFGLDDLSRAKVSRRAILPAVLACAAYVGWAVYYINTRNYSYPERWTIAYVIGTLAALTVVAAAALLAARREGADGRRSSLLPAAAAALIVATGAGHYAVPQLSASPPGKVDLEPVRFLQANLGTSRFFTLGPIQPNYGSYFRIAQLNVNDLPVPQKLADYISDEIKPDPAAPGAKATRLAYAPYLLVTRNYDRATQRNLLLGYGQKQKAYQDAAVKYLVTSPGVVDQKSAQAYGLTKAFSSPKTEIWQDKAAAPYYSSDGACTIVAESMFDVTVDCSEPATLTRRQLLTPGWTVTVNDTEHTLTDRKDQLFQQVSVPAGRSTVTYSYLPAHFVPASIVSLALVALMFADAIRGVLLRRRRTGPIDSKRAHVAERDDSDESADLPSGSGVRQAQAT